jgi:hypothetical protein
MADSNYPVAMGIPVAESTTADTSYPERPAAFNRAKTEASLHALTHKGYPIGLVTALRGSLEAFPLRIWIVDNSGSMASSDGCRFVKRPGTASYKKVATRHKRQAGWDSRISHFQMARPISGHTSLSTLVSMPAVRALAGVRCDVVAHGVEREPLEVVELFELGQDPKPAKSDSGRNRPQPGSRGSRRVQWAVARQPNSSEATAM